jgi:hypothetical protein
MLITFMKSYKQVAPPEFIKYPFNTKRPFLSEQPSIFQKLILYQAHASVYKLSQLGTG